MNKEILKNINIYVGIDTLQVRSDSESKLTHSEAPYINKTICLNADTGAYSYRLNPDKANDNLNIYNYGDYERICSVMINEMGLENPVKTRIDFRVDSFDNNYAQLEKLNKLIILLLAQCYTLHNRYQSKDPLTLDSLCIRVQSDRLEVENYNKGIQEPMGEVKNRIEFRSKKLSDTDFYKEPTEFLKWCSRLDKAVTKENYLQLQNTANFYLVQQYKQEKIENATLTLNEFLHQYRSNIWTRQQLINFFTEIGCKNPIEQAKAYKRRKEIEFFTFKDLRFYIDKIKQAGNDFFMIA